MAKIVINGTKNRRPGMRNVPTLELKREDHMWRSHALTRWPRGFPIADAPPDCNEWTRHMRSCSNGRR